jgi:hypothetical protein
MRKQSLFVFAASLAWQLVLAVNGFAQAWLPPKGEAWFSLGYSHQVTIDHFFSRGERVQQGHILTDTAVADVGYAITDSLLVRGNLPWVASIYKGNNPHAFPIDDGTTHGTFTDFRLGVHFNALNGPVAITPFVAGIVPSHHYEYFGHAINGTDLRQFLIGLSSGGRIGSRVYVQGRYSYAFVEKVLEISHDRSNLDVQVGYFVKPSLQIYVLGMGQKTHGGLVLDKPTIVASWTAADFHYHGQVGQSDLLGVGGGAVFQVTPVLEVSAGYMSTVAGRNDHAVNSLVTLGMTVGFSPRQVIRRLTSRPSSGESGSGS